VGTHGRCKETAFLEFHHVEPFAAGGAATSRNVQLRCRPHNLYEAELFFGPAEPPMVRETRALFWTRRDSVQTESTRMGVSQRRASLVANYTAHESVVAGKKALDFPIPGSDHPGLAWTYSRVPRRDQIQKTTSSRFVRG
jgi:hypothetical protein